MSRHAKGLPNAVQPAADTRPPSFDPPGSQQHFPAHVASNPSGGPTKAPRVFGGRVPVAVILIMTAPHVAGRFPRSGRWSRYFHLRSDADL